MSSGKDEASTTRRPWTPKTRALESTTAIGSFVLPILPEGQIALGGSKQYLELEKQLTSAARVVYGRSVRSDIVFHLSICHNIFARESLLSDKNRSYSTRFEQCSCSLERLNQDVNVSRVAQPAWVDEGSIFHIRRCDRDAPARQRGDQCGKNSNIVLQWIQFRPDREGSDHVFDLWPVRRKLCQSR